jgi:hypothetical protein
MLSSLGFCNCPIEQGTARVQQNKKRKKERKKNLEQATKAQRGSRGIFLSFL